MFGVLALLENQPISNCLLLSTKDQICLSVLKIWIHPSIYLSIYLCIKFLLHP